MFKTAFVQSTHVTPLAGKAVVITVAPASGHFPPYPFSGWSSMPGTCKISICWGRVFEAAVPAKMRNRSIDSPMHAAENTDIVLTWLRLRGSEARILVRKE